MRTPRSLVLPVLTAATLLAAVPAAAPAAPAGWTSAASFAAGDDEQSEPVPRAAIAADGTSAVAFSSKSGALMLATATAGGRFSAPRVIQRTGVDDYSIAATSGGAFMLAWQDAAGLHTVLRTKSGRALVRRAFKSTPVSEINGVTVAADPRGGYALAERLFPFGPRNDRLYGVRVRSLDPAGRMVGAAQDLGAGQFGIDARPTQSLAVGGDGRAVLTFTREVPSSSPLGTPVPVVVSVRPHGGAFSTPVALAGSSTADPRVAVDGAGRAVIAATQVASRGDAGVFGGPIVAAVRPDGTLGAPLGPALRYPGRAFAPSVALTRDGAGVLVFALKTKSEAFATEAPVRAVAFDAAGALGPLQTLTTGRAKEPVAMALSGGRVLTVWSGRKGLGAALAGPDGVFRKTAEPKGPPPPPFHTNSTNRDLRTAGRYAIFTWARDGRVRVAVRRF
jgi:hypothetical protein